MCFSGAITALSIGGKRLEWSVSLDKTHLRFCFSIILNSSSVGCYNRVYERHYILLRASILEKNGRWSQSTAQAGLSRQAIKCGDSELVCHLYLKKRNTKFQNVRWQMVWVLLSIYLWMFAWPFKFWLLIWMLKMKVMGS